MVKEFVEGIELNESYLSKILQHIEDPMMVFGVISAFRDELPREKNEGRHLLLKDEVRKNGYGYIEMDSGWVAKKGSVRIMEDKISLFIPKIEYKGLIDLGNKYDQHSVIHKGVSGERVEFREYAAPGSGLSAGAILNDFHKPSSKCSIGFSKDTAKGFFSALFNCFHRGRKLILSGMPLDLTAECISDIQEGKNYYFAAEYVWKGVLGHYHTTKPLKYLIHLEGVEIVEDGA